MFLLMSYINIIFLINYNRTCVRECGCVCLCGVACVGHTVVFADLVVYVCWRFRLISTSYFGNINSFSPQAADNVYSCRFLASHFLAPPPPLSPYLGRSSAVQLGRGRAEGWPFQVRQLAVFVCVCICSHIIFNIFFLLVTRHWRLFPGDEKKIFFSKDFRSFFFVFPGKTFHRQEWNVLMVSEGHIYSALAGCCPSRHDYRLQSDGFKTVS